MSDIGIDFGWPDLILFALMYAFWPLAGATALFAFLFWRTRVTRASTLNRRLALGALIVTGVPSVVSLAGWSYVGVSQFFDARSAEAYAKDHTRTLAAPETIGTLRFPAGSVVFDDRVARDPISVTLPNPATIAGIPVAGVVQVDAKSGLTGTLSLTRDATIGGMLCDASEPAGFIDGKLSSCLLKKPARIAGVPCIGHAEFGGNLDCTLASGHRMFGVTFAAGTQWATFPSFTMVTIGSEPPDLRVRGEKLGSGTIVRFQNGGIDVETPVSAHGCDARDVVYNLRSHSVTALGDGDCRFALPRSTFAFAKLGAP